MELESLRVGIALAGVGAAALYDVFNRRNVPNWLSYLLVALGFAVNLYSFQLGFFVQAVVPALVFFAFGFLLYREGQLGGADVLVFTALALLLPAAPGAQGEKAVGMAVAFPFVLSVFAYSGALFLLVFSIAKIPVAVRAVADKKIALNATTALLGAAIIAFCAVFLNVIGSFGFSYLYFAVVAAIALCSLFLSFFKESIIASMVEWVPISGIEEEDVLAVDHMKPGLVKKLGLQRLLTAAQIEKLRKTRLKKFPVLKKLPSFLPFALAGLLLALKYGDVVALLARLALEGGV